jgi:hypothetical protein
MALPGRILIDGNDVVGLTNGSFVSIPVTPRTYSVQAGGPFFVARDSNMREFPELKVTTKVGESYFIRQDVLMGNSSSYLMQTGGTPIPIGAGQFIFRANMVGREDGKAAIKKLKQLKSKISY